VQILSGETARCNGGSDQSKDADNDGVSALLNICANTAKERTVDVRLFSDTPKDGDNDVVSDAIGYLVGHTAKQEKSQIPMFCSACQQDTDNDGVSDAY